MLDVSLVLFVGLAILFCWRFIFWWRWGGKWLEYANYGVLLYVLLLVILIYVIVQFLIDALGTHGKASWGKLPSYFHPAVLIAIPVACVTYLVCVLQAASHVNKIRLNESAHMHDRVVQIVSLPAVYTVMALASLSRMFGVVAHGLELSDTNTPEYQHLSEFNLQKSEASFWVGDLYESWALYQFSKLTMELLSAAFARLGTSRNEQERNTANGLLLAYPAVDSLAWLGVFGFLVVAIAHSGWSLWLLTFATDDEDMFNSSQNVFYAAGTLASGAAIWNITIVEHTFSNYFEGYNPFLKFITVKILVSFAFFQRGAISVLKALQSTLPGLTSNLIRKCPVIGALVNLPEDQFEIFYACLLIYECFLVALMHGWAWSPKEVWYKDSLPGELRPLTAPKAAPRQPVVRKP